jgi:NADH-quinone oxidoreductase subunit L
VIGVVATGVAFIGLFAGLGAWRQKVDVPVLEPDLLAHGWYIDEGVALAVSGPLTRAANDVAFGVDEQFVDGTVNDIGRFAAATGRQLRRLQTGYVRNYALGIGIGAAAILFFVALRAAS